MKVKGIKRVISYYKIMIVGNTLEVYYRPSKHELFSEELVIGFYKKCRDNLTMNILRDDIEEALK
ncbi:hypothetical protein [Enterococcus cecorum]|uniref:hypothetical protein n=1 Tax=Enterococcus cecorum TaxID=44008 RepID=UPI001FACF195|nr:hypothetical protein [Enterococcus cecorum]MCJ0563007.1 hypothetical protein [Enterococcus cecorum]